MRKLRLGGNRMGRCAARPEALVQLGELSAERHEFATRWFQNMNIRSTNFNANSQSLDTRRRFELDEKQFCKNLRFVRHDGRMSNAPRILHLLVHCGSSQIVRDHDIAEDAWWCAWHRGWKHCQAVCRTMVLGPEVERATVP